MTYTEATSSVEGGSGAVFAARLAWPAPEYIGLGSDGVTLKLYINSQSSGTTYSPSQADLNGTDWIKGGDRPPSRA